MNGIIGLTKNGKVSITILTTLEGKPVATTAEMSPDAAREMATNLNAAAQRAEEINVRNGANPN